MPPREIRTLLLVKTSSLGDIVHNFPAVTDLVRNRPDITIDWLVERPFADVVRLHPAVRHVPTVALRQWRRGLLSRTTWKDAFHTVAALRDGHYDAVVDSQGLLKSAVLSRLARGPAWGANFASAREAFAAALYQRRVPVLWQQHAAYRNRELMARLFNYPIPQDAPDYGLPAPDPQQGNTAVCFTATSRRSKLWPLASWRAVVQHLAHAGLQVCLPQASAEEEQAARAIQHGIAGVTVLPRMSLASLAQVLAHARVVAGVDTGLVHLATALSRPTVAIYVASDPALNGALAGARGQALNVGGLGRSPTVGDVLGALAEMDVACG